MKNILRTFGIIICFMVSTISCKKDFLNTKPLTEFSPDDIWHDPNLIQAFVNGIYLNVDNPANGGDGLLKAEFVDEMHDQWFSFFEFNNSLITPDDLASWPHENWEKLYKNIRACNIFFEKINSSTFDASIKVDGASLKDRMAGEVYFLRAYLYHQLVSLYGGVPLITKAYGLNDTFEVKRASYSDCISFITKQCDSAAALLPLVQSGSNMGRVTKGAALTLKARTLLYAASDLHNKTVFQGYPHQELVRYMDEDRDTRWRATRDAAKAVMDLGIYHLYKANPAPGDPVSQNFSNIFLSDGTEEDIWVRYFKVTSLNGSPDLNSLSLVSGPNGYHLYGQDTPSGEMVDHFEMSDGTPFSWTDPLKSTEPYKNRDPRFYASILYEGVKFKPRPADITGLDPVGVIQVGTWQRWNSTSNSMEEVYGLDSRKGPVENFNGGYTGYYLKKFIDPAVNGQFSTNGTPWRYMRYAEVLLNYAEACIALNQETDAKDALNQIRKRAGMPNITESGIALRDRYRNERRVELAFEEHRFYDVRRWLIASEAYQQFSGVNVVYKLNANHTTATIPTITPYVVQQSAWLDKAYLFPVSRDEMNKNSLLFQNPNY
ncbi:RagB/SusD family nutrient uptake outer membrane protein [Pedobacter foliorum]|uniref:RagB/SusD family nutrient uptake outer membrane protein n=1 Tax=Pedobacter foliorum TaxID=2739058 RepID=UPI001FE4F466|nr:RagB/SusD family nutrient uptake outer membrane protein [Pedobacter foliorum]